MVKACKSIGGIWLKWIYFISILAIICLLPIPFMIGGGVNDARDLVQNYMFNVSFPCFPAVGGSIWFMPHYFTVILVNHIVLAGMQRSIDYKNCKKIYCVALLILFLWTAWGHSFFGIDQYFWFYSFFWMLGNRCEELKIRSCKEFVLRIVEISVMWGVFSYLTGIPFIDLQSSKFPPGAMYLAASMLAVVIVIYKKDRKKKENKWLNHIGKNAIFYYFGQGVGSSLMYYIVPKWQINNWFFKWLGIYLCNIVITSLVAELLRYTYKYLEVRVKTKFNFLTG